MKFSLRMIRSSGDSEILELESFPVLIGRGEDCDVSIDDGKASRAHARIDLQRDEDGETVLVVEDLDSSNGTFVNGERVVQSALTNGDRIGLGESELEVVLDGAAAAAGASCPTDSRPFPFPRTRTSATWRPR